MLLLCDETLILPLQIIFTNILTTSIYPDMWKLANVTPIFKKGDKQLIKNYRPISLLPICGKILEKVISNNLYSYLHTNNLITRNQSVFVLEIPQPTNYYTSLMKSILTVQNPLKYCSWKVRLRFLDTILNARSCNLFILLLSILLWNIHTKGQ